MATNKTKPSKTKQDRYAKYKLANKFNANFIKRLERHLKKYPNDTCAKEALKKGPKFTRKKPEEKLGWVSNWDQKKYGVLRPLAAYSAMDRKRLESNVKLTPVVTDTSTSILKFK